MFYVIAQKQDTPKLLALKVFGGYTVVVGHGEPVHTKPVFNEFMPSVDYRLEGMSNQTVLFWGKDNAEQELTHHALVIRSLGFTCPPLELISLEDLEKRIKIYFTAFAKEIEENGGRIHPADFAGGEFLKRLEAIKPNPPKA